MISIVVPCYKSSETITKVIELTRLQLNEMGYKQLEFILVNDCSPDENKTIVVLKKLADQFRDVKVINLGKNVGQHNAMMAGLHYANGETIISMDDDLQTHPSQLPKMFDAYDQGYDVVYGYYEEKKHSIFRNLGSWFNRMTVAICLNKPNEIRSSSFWIMRKYVKDSVLRYNGSHTYLLGLILQATSNIKSVPVEHFEREVGESGYDIKRLIKLWSNVIGFSSKPLQLALGLGFVLSFLSVVAAIIIIIEKIINPEISVGWPSTMVAILFGTGINLFFIGLVGEYVGRIYIYLNSEPQFVVKETFNIEENK